MYRGRESNSHAFKAPVSKTGVSTISTTSAFVSRMSKNFLFLSYYDVNITSCFTKAKHVLKTFFLLFARVERFELPTTVLETGMIPFHHTRIFEVSIGFEPI